MALHVHLADRLGGYFAQASPLIRATQASQPIPRSVPAARLASILRQARDPLEQLQGAACSNVWATAGLGTDEVRICSVLAKLWDWHHYGHEGRNFLARSLTILKAERAPSDDELRQGYRIQTEHCPNGNQADRVDITVETDRSIIGIEVKIHAGEGKRQLARYIETISQRAQLTRRSNPQVVLLSPRRPADQQTSASWLTWR